MADETGFIDMDEERFESHLDEKSKEKAKKELHEINDRDRMLAVDAFRSWIKQQPWLKTPLGTEFLIRHLRVRKYAQLNARESLENYWTTRTKHPEWFENVDPLDPVLVEIMQTGIYTAIKKLDSDGCRVITARFGTADVDKIKRVWKKDNVLKALFLFYEWVTSDENVQVNGIKLFGDYSNVTMSHFALFSEQRGTMVDYYQKTLPLRMKAFYIYNEPPFYDAIYTMFSRFVSSKIKNRIHLLGRNMTKVYAKLDKSVLPDEYLPDDYEGESAGPISKIVDEMVEDMQKPKFRNYMLKISAPGVYKVDLEMRKHDTKNNKTSTPVASFRKLNVD